MRIPASRRVFFPGVMGWGEGDIQMSRRRRWSPLDGRWPRFRTIHSFPDGPFPGSSKTAQKAQKVMPLSHQIAPVGPKVRKVHVFQLILDQLMPLSCEIDEKTPLSSEICFATGHSPGAPKAAPVGQKVKPLSLSFAPVGQTNEKRVMFFD